MASYVPVIKNGANGAVFYIGLTPATANGRLQSNPTLAAGDVTISKDGGAFANLNTLPDAEPNSTKGVRVILSQTECNADNIQILFSDQTDPPEWCDCHVNIQTVARQIDDLLAPTVSGRTLDVTATGEAGIDWANIGSPTTTVGLSGTTVKTATDVETDTADIQSRLPAALVSGRIDASVGAIAANAITAASMAADASAEIADAVWDEDATGHQTQGTFGQAIGDPAADANTIYGAVVTGAAGATVAADIIAIKAETAEILTDTGTTLQGELDGIQADTEDIQTRLPAALGANGNIKADVRDWLATAAATPSVAGVPEVDLTHVNGSTNTVTIIGRYFGQGLGAVFGTADSGTATTMVDAALTEADTDYWKGAMIIFTSGTIAGQARIITGFTPGTDTVTFHPATTQAVGTNTYIIMAHAPADVWGVLGSTTTLPTVAAAIQAKTDNLPSDPADASVIAARFDTLDTAVADLPTNAELATSQAAADDATLAAIAALNNLSAAQVNAEVVDALATDTYAEPGQGAPAATLSLSGKVNYLYKAWRNKSDQTSTLYRLYGDDATTVDHKAIVSDDGATFTKGEVATGP